MFHLALRRANQKRYDFLVPENSTTAKCAMPPPPPPPLAPTGAYREPPPPPAPIKLTPSPKHIRLRADGGRATVVKSMPAAKKKAKTNLSELPQPKPPMPVPKPVPSSSSTGPDPRKRPAHPFYAAWPAQKASQIHVFSVSQTVVVAFVPY